MVSPRRGDMQEQRMEVVMRRVFVLQIVRSIPMDGAEVHVAAFSILSAAMAAVYKFILDGRTMPPQDVLRLVRSVSWRLDEDSDDVFAECSELGDHGFRISECQVDP